MIYKTLDVVFLIEDINHLKIKKGDSGTIVEIYKEPNECYEIEFVNDKGETIDIITLLPKQIKLLWRFEK